MIKLALFTIAATTLLTFAGPPPAEAEYIRRQGYQEYHYAPRSYRSRDRVVYRRGYTAPSRGYYNRYGERHYGQRTLYFNFFGLPVVTY